MKRDNFILGLIIGLIFPMIAFVLIYIFWFYDRMTIQHFIGTLRAREDMLAGIMSLSLILNLPIFFVNIWALRYNIARGVIFATMLYGIVIIYLKLF